jgi:hypothetical protein
VQGCYDILADFEDFDQDKQEIITELVSCFPEQYQDDYTLWGCREILMPGENAEDLPLITIMKRKAFKKFDAWVEQEFRKKNKDG